MREVRSSVRTRAASDVPVRVPASSARGSAARSAIVRPEMVTARDSARSLRPPHRGQGVLVRKRSAFARRVGLFVSAKVFMT